jgi:Family of unknown function (DUF6247)
MARVTETLDLVEVFAVLESWRRIAWMTSTHGPDEHRRMYRRAAARLTGHDIAPDEDLAQTKARLGLQPYTVTTDEQTHQQLDALPARTSILDVSSTSPEAA